ncbi:MAG: GNAT family N-acetyltransferase [Elusimicrobia bacterium]|nr:GNAT family N-acetyltransferase [Elusimicrobiota bacterium]
MTEPEEKIPTDSLKARRLFLRPLEESDAAALFEAVHKSREILKRRLDWISEVHSQEDSLRFIRKAVQEKTDGTGAYFGIFEKRNQELVGVAGLSLLVGQNASRAKLGMWVRSDKQNQGYATEAARSVCEYGFRDLNLHRIYARIDPANRSSRKVLMKLGFRYEGSLRDEKKLNGRWINHECWGFLKDEWKK